jgi:hypothetical protein
MIKENKAILSLPINEKLYFYNICDEHLIIDKKEIGRLEKECPGTILKWWEFAASPEPESLEELLKCSFEEVSRVLNNALLKKEHAISYDFLGNTLFKAIQKLDSCLKDYANDIERNILEKKLKPLNEIFIKYGAYGDDIERDVYEAFACAKRNNEIINADSSEINEFIDYLSKQLQSKEK